MGIRLMHSYLLRTIISPFLVSFIMFTLFVETMDLIRDLIRYLNLEVSFSIIAKIQLLYLPTSITYALPIAILFSITFSIGQINANNELISVFVSGVSLFRFIFPLLFCGFLISIGMFYFDELYVIDTFRQKSEMRRQLLNQNIEQSNDQVALIQDGGRIAYYANYYNDVSKELSDVIIIITNDDNQLLLRINAQTAVWSGQEWVFKNVRLYMLDSETKKFSVTIVPSYKRADINVPPNNFKRIISNVEEMKFFDALKYVHELRIRGLAYKKLLTDVYSRLPLALSPFIVTIMGCLSGSIFKKNILLMSLLTALCISILYYISDVMGNIFASRSIFPPILGAWFGFIFTLLVSIIVYNRLAIK